MRLLLAAIVALCPTLTMADESISGQWRTTPNHGVLINMDILVDGHWSSQTIQNNKVVAQIAGTYSQTKTSDNGGRIIFTPMTSKTTSEHGAVDVEADTYTLTGKTLLLVSDGDKMVFHKQPLAK